MRHKTNTAGIPWLPASQRQGCCGGLEAWYCRKEASFVVTQDAHGPQAVDWTSPSSEGFRGPSTTKTQTSTQHSPLTVHSLGKDLVR